MQLNLRRNKSQNTAPAETYATATEESQIKAVRSALDLVQDLGVIVGDAWRKRLLTLLHLTSWRSI